MFRWDELGGRVILLEFVYSLPLKPEVMSMAVPSPLSSLVLIVATITCDGGSVLTMDSKL